MPAPKSSGARRSWTVLLAGVIVTVGFSINGSVNLVVAKDPPPAPLAWNQAQQEITILVRACLFEKALQQLTNFIDANPEFGPAYEQRAWIMLEWLDLRDEIALTDTPQRRRPIRDPASDLSNVDPPVEARRVFLEDRFLERYTPPIEMKSVEQDLGSCRRLMGDTFDDRPMLAFVAEFVGDINRARKLIGTQCAEGTGTPREYLTYSRILKSQKDIAGALAAVELAWKAPETRGQAAPRKLNLLRTQNRIKDASAFFDAWGETASRDPRYLYTRTTISLEPKVALKDFETLIALMPTESGLFYGLAARDIQFRKDMELSKIHLNRAVELNPKSLLPYYARSCLKSKLGDFNSALVDATEAIKCSPYFDQSYQVRSKVYQKLGNTELARQDDLRRLWLKELYDLYTSYKSNPQNVNAAIALGKHFAKAKDWEPALQTLSGCLKVSPKHMEALSQRCQVYLALGKLDQALADASRAVEVKPDAGSYSLRGDVFFERQEWDAAVADYERAKVVDDRLEQALRRRAAWHTASGRAEAAKADLQRAGGISKASFTAP